MLLCCLSAAAVQAADPMESGACQQAMTVLRDVEAALAAAAAASPASSNAQQSNRDRLAALQRRAASTCLYNRADAAPAAPSRAPAAPGGRAAMPGAAPARTVPASAPPSPGRSTTPPQAAPPVLSLVTCDATGCWASDGTRLQRSGTLLLGPRGYCSAVGSVLNCP